MSDHNLLSALAGSPVSQSTASRFWKHVDKSGDCWNWMAGLTSAGYGSFKIKNGRPTWMTVQAHRMAYELTKGDIPKGLYVCHTCDNPICVKPDHLYLGTPSDNNRDAKERGRLNPSVGERNSHAKLTPEQVSEIRNARGQLSQRKLARLYGITASTVWHIQARRTWVNV